MIYVIAAWVMLSGVADVITTERALARGARELNPIMRAMQEATGRFWWVGKLLVHAVIAGVVLFLDGGLGVAIGATVAGVTFQAIDYADMVRLALRLVREREDVVARLRSDYKVILLDEYQDTSVAQRMLMTTAFGDGHAVTAVGDALQAIYEWRGANAQNIVEFPQHFPRTLADGTAADAPVYGLPTTQRFGSRIAALANDLTVDLRAGLEGVEPLEAESDEQYGPGIGVVALHADSEQEFAWIAEQLQEEHASTAWDRMAVLVREHQHSADIYAALTGAGIPAQIVGKQGLLQIPDIAELVVYLRVINDPAANPSWVRLLSGMRYRVGVRDLAHLGKRAVVEMGRGTPEELKARLQPFVQTLPSVASRNGRKVAALESADLRHENGYALRMRGITTVDPQQVKK